MSGDVEALAEIVTGHAYTYPDSFCACGAAMVPTPWRQWGEHVAAAITASPWLATQIAAAEQRGRADERERIGHALLIMQSHEIRANLAETALANLRAKVEAAFLIAEAKYGIQSSPVAQLRDLLDGGA